MNVRLKKTWHVPAVVLSARYDNMVSNIYTITAEMTTADGDNDEYNIAYERINHWMRNVFQDSFLVDDEHPRLAAFRNTGERVLVFPDDPVDQLVGIALYCKLSAMVEGRLIIDNLSVSSGLDDHITYVHDADDVVGVFADDGWWNHAGPIWQHKNKSHRRGEKIIALGRMPEWKDYQLDWDQDTPDTGPAVVTVFNKDDPK